jgi:hypothetical protein
MYSSLSSKLVVLEALSAEMVLLDEANTPTAEKTKS